MMLSNNIYKQRGFFTSQLPTIVLWTIVLLISASLTGLFAIAFVNNLKEGSVKSELVAYSQEITNQINQNYIAINSSVSNSVTKHIADYSSELKDVFIDRINNEIPDTLRVIVSGTPLSEIKPIEFPGINFATLDMLKNTQKDNENPIPEIHLFGQKNQYLNYIFILDNAKQEYLIVSLPINQLLINLPNINIQTGQIKLIQTAGSFSKVVLKSWGSPPASQDLTTGSNKITNSYFSIDYSYEKPFFFMERMTTLSSFIGMLSALILLVAASLTLIKFFRAIKQKQNQESTYVHVSTNKKVFSIEDSNQETDLANNLDKEEMKDKIEIDKSIFRAYDIRGIVDTQLTVASVTLIGQAIGTENIKRGKNSIVVARDGRLSGEKLLSALIDGLIASGCDVINIGAVPTGVLYFATHHLETGSGVMLTGSHNPPNYNGLKIMLNGETLAGQLIMDLHDSIIYNELDSGDGSVQEMDIVDDYVDYISSDIQLENELKVVVDSGNGIGGEVGPLVLEEIGCDVIPLHCEIDGSFPNHHPDPSVPDNLKDLIAAVKASDADLGIAFDGDADRLGVVTKTGEIIYSDRVLMLFAKDVLTRQPGASIIFDVKCTGHLPKEIVKSGGLPIIWKTGHSFMKAKLKETKAALAGEMSGHFFFNERWFGFDDGIYSAARLLEILDQEDRPAQEVFDELPDSVSTPELKCHTEEGENYAFMEKFKEAAKFPDANLTTIDGIRADFANGWGLVRCSNTTPCLVMRFDADNQEALDDIMAEFKEQILAVDSSLNLPF
ncbi:MAG: phosphomannomutase/phosphoglucomutase [Marinicellaceae bacterium]